MNAVKALEKYAAEHNCHLAIHANQVHLTAPAGKRFYAAAEATPHVLVVTGSGGCESLAASLYELVGFGLEECRCQACRSRAASRAERN